MNVDLTGISAADLRKALAEKEKNERAARLQEQKDYEVSRDSVVESMIERAKEISKLVKEFKETLTVVFDNHKEKLDQYGGIRGNSKGGFSLVHSSGNIKVSRNRSTKPVWDERSVKAIELISSFLMDTVKKKDATLFEILYSFIKKNEKGDLEYSRVMELLTHKDKYNDPRWVEGLDLIRESFSTHLRGYGYDFSQKDDQGKFQRIDVNFTSL